MVDRTVGFSVIVLTTMFRNLRLFSRLNSWKNMYTKSSRIFMYEAVKYWNHHKGNRRFFTVYALSFWSSVSPNSISSRTDLYMKKEKDYIKQADIFFEACNYNDVISLLAPYKDTDDVEVLWRLARAEYKLASNKDVSENEKKTRIFSAYAMILRAMELDENNFAVHKWMSVLLDERSAYNGIKARITQLERVKAHMLRANELNPKDATTLHMLGTWCFGVADMPWLQRKLAATIFVAPPTSTYEEALMYFKKAEEVQPMFYSQNLLMLGKTYLKLKKEDEARYYLNLARDYQGTTEEDKEARKEASQLLSGLKQKV